MERSVHTWREIRTRAARRPYLTFCVTHRKPQNAQECTHEIVYTERGSYVMVYSAE
jgi:hypothetical protein